MDEAEGFATGKRQLLSGSPLAFGERHEMKTGDSWAICGGVEHGAEILEAPPSGGSIFTSERRLQVDRVER